MKKKGLWKSRKTVGGLLGLLVPLAVLPAPANAYQRPGITERVSVASGGGEGNAASYDPAISGDGRFVAFPSTSSNLVPGDTNGVFGTDIFVHDRDTGTTELISMTSGGTQGNSHSYDPDISAPTAGTSRSIASPLTWPPETRTAPTTCSSATGAWGPPS